MHDETGRLNEHQYFVISFISVLVFVVPFFKVLWDIGTLDKVEVGVCNLLIIVKKDHSIFFFVEENPGAVQYFVQTPVLHEAKCSVW